MSCSPFEPIAAQVLALDLGADDTLRVVDLGCGLMPLLQDFRDLAKACGARRLEYCGLEKEADVASEAVQVRGLRCPPRPLPENIPEKRLPATAADRAVWEN